MDKTCSNCRFSKNNKIRDHKLACEEPNNTPGDGTYLAIVPPDATCPRHEAKIEFPKWTPEWHPGSEEPRHDVRVLAVWNESYWDKTYFFQGKWRDAEGGTNLEPICWTYLPEGWE